MPFKPAREVAQLPFPFGFATAVGAVAAVLLFIFGVSAYLNVDPASLPEPRGLVLLALAISLTALLRR